MRVMQVMAYPVSIIPADKDTHYYACPDLPGCHGVLPGKATKFEDAIRAAIVKWESEHPEVVAMNIPPYVAHLEGEPNAQE